MALAAASSHAARMNRKYGRVRHVYDLTRKHFLFGRDRAIGYIRSSSPSTILEIGCGTGRNLVHLAADNREADVYGIDISSEMLKTAAARTSRLSSVRIALSDACEFDLFEVFGLQGADAVLMSFSISMIPDQRTALRRAIRSLSPGGTLWIVDFGDFAGFGPLSGIAKRALARADAPPVEDMAGLIGECIPADGSFGVATSTHLGGFYVLATVTRTA